MELTKEDFEKTMKTVPWGTLILCDDECKPYPVPVNFGYDNNKIYFHGKPKGNKYNYLLKIKKLQFIVVDEYSLIPSYFPDESSPCFASQCFISIKITAELRVLSSPGEKADAMTILVHKLQPEGRFKPDPITKDVKYLADFPVYELTIMETSCRQKFCQGYNHTQITKIKEHLKERGTPNDLRTIEMINKYYIPTKDIIK